jgi:hypothetical protein
MGVGAATSGYFVGLLRPISAVQSPPDGSSPRRALPPFCDGLGPPGLVGRLTYGQFCDPSPSTLRVSTSPAERERLLRRRGHAFLHHGQVSMFRTLLPACPVA